MTDYLNRPRVIEVIESETPRGRGIEKDPHRNVVQYHTLDGVFLAEVDPCPEAVSQDKDWAAQLLRESAR